MRLRVRQLIRKHLGLDPDRDPVEPQAAASTWNEAMGTPVRRAGGFRVRSPGSELKRTQPIRFRHGRQHGFTMVEIALCLAVIGFALVAIIGVLPLGMQVQKDNREDTIVSTDGAYLLDVIRNGNYGSFYLTQYVERITLFEERNGNIISNLNVRVDLASGSEDTFNSTEEIVGLLSQPYPPIVRAEAVVRAISGSAEEKGVGDKVPETAFKYHLTSEVLPITGVIYTNDIRHQYTNDISTNILQTLQTNMHEVRLTIRYPLLPNNQPGGGKQVFRSLVSGELYRDITNDLYFFRPGLFARP